MFKEDIKKKFLMWLRDMIRIGGKKLGEKLGTGEYAPIYPQKRLIFVHKICIIF